MAFEQPPIQENTTAPNGKFPQVWIYWFNRLTEVIDNLQSGGVTSVNGQTGTVVLDSDDINEGTVNLYNKIPSGGTTNQALTKSSNSDYALQWSDIVLQGQGLDLNISTITADYTPDGDDYTILCNTSSGAINVNLPSASGLNGSIFNIKIIDATNTVTINGNGSETIDGSLTAVLTVLNDCVTIQSNGSNWYII